MKSIQSFVVVGVASLLLVTSVWADADPAKRAQSPEKLGRVLFKTSCSPEAQKQF